LVRPLTPNVVPSKVRFASASNSVVVEPTVTNSFAVALFNAVTAGASKAGGDPAPVDVKTCPSEPVAIATGFPDAS